MTRISAAIFAGGKSSRFGTPKINATLDGYEFGRRIVSAIRQVHSGEIFQIGGNPADADKFEITYVADEFVDQGPFGALITALRACSSEFLMILPCDVPYIDAACCEQLMALSDDADVRIAVTDSPQWLCSTWRVSILQNMSTLFDGGERSIHKAVENIRKEFVNVSAGSLKNVNEQSDLGDE